MKRMKRWLGIILSIMLAAESLQVPVHAAGTGETAIEAAETGDTSIEATSSSDEADGAVAEEAGLPEAETPVSETIPEKAATEDVPAAGSASEEDIDTDEAEDGRNPSVTNDDRNPSTPEDDPEVSSSEELREETNNDAVQAVASGTCGNSLNWTLDFSGTLEITGSGAMSDYSHSYYQASYNSPWYPYCESITEVALPDGITHIGNCAFFACSNLDELEIPDSVTSLGYFFLEDSAVSSIRIPASISSCNTMNRYFGHKAGPLAGSNVTEVIFAEGTKVIPDYICKGEPYIDQIGEIEYYKTIVDTVVIPEGVETIGEGAFGDCEKLGEIRIPYSVTEIKGAAFQDYGSRCTLHDVYYGGSEDDWNKVKIDGGNDLLLNADIHFGDSAGSLELDPEFTGTVGQQILISATYKGKKAITSANLDADASDAFEIGEPSILGPLDNGNGPETYISFAVTAKKAGEFNVTMTVSDGTSAETVIKVENKDVAAISPGAVLKEFSTDLGATIKSEKEITESDVSFVIKDVGASDLSWGECTIRSEGEDLYSVTKSVVIKKSGKYTFSVSYQDASDQADFDVLDYESVIELGPRFESGKLAYKELTKIAGYCDVRYVLKIKDNKNLSEDGYKELLERCLESVDYNQAEVAEIFRIVSDKKQISEDGYTGERIIRVVPISYEEKEYDIEFKELSGKTLSKSGKASNGIKKFLNYRADKDYGAHDDFHQFFYSDRFFYSNATEYNNTLAVMTLGMEMAAFSDVDQDSAYEIELPDNLRANNIMEAYQAFLFDEYSLRLYKYGTALTNSDDSAAVSIATKYISSEDTDDTLIAVVVRGGGYGAEWASNFRVGENSDSQGFREAAGIIYSNFEKYVAELREQGKIIGDVKLWITGFSRGAAIANLFSHKVNSSGSISGVQIQKTDNYTYVFACPGGHYGKNTGADDNIFNIVSENDLVPRIPLKQWNFGRYGQDVILPTKTPDAVKNRFNTISGLDFAANNIKELEDLITNIMYLFVPSRGDYVDFVQEHMVRWEKIIGELNVGNFMWGIGIGLLSAAKEAKDTLKSKNVLDIPKKLELIFGKDFSRVAAIKHTVTQTDLSGVAPPDMEADYAKVHYPEHYLAWLETGGLTLGSIDLEFAAQSDSRRETINNTVKKFIGRAPDSTRFTTVEVDGTTDLSIIRRNNLTFSARSYEVSEDDGYTLFRSEDLNVSMALLKAENDYSLKISADDVKSVVFSVGEYTAESTLRIICYDLENVEDGSYVTLTINRNDEEEDEYHVKDSDGNDIEPYYDSSEENIVHSGELEGSLFWKLNDNGVLTVYGDGRMPEFMSTDLIEEEEEMEIDPYDLVMPWVEYRDDIYEIIIEDGVLNVGSYAFMDCRNCHTVTIAGSVTSIGDEAFAGCESLKTLNWQEGIENIGEKAFVDCDSLVTVEIPEGVRYLGSYAFAWSESLESAVIPDSVEEGGINIFGEDTALSDVTMGSGLAYVPQGIFYACTDLEQITVPEGVKELSFCVFEECSSLQSIYLPESLESVYEDAFLECGALRYVYYSGTRAQWKEIDIGSRNNCLRTQLIRCADGDLKLITTSMITLSQSVYNYSGQAFTPAVTVRNDGTVLNEGTHYTVRYLNNINAGTATVAVTGKGEDYWGTAKKTFAILPGKTTRGDMFNLANNVKVTWKEVRGAKYYRVYREGVTEPSESRDKPVIVTTGLVGWDNQPGLTNGHAYRYRIVASLTGVGDSSGDSKLSYSKLMYRLKTVVIRSVKNTAPGAVTVKYDRTTAGDSYVLQYCERQDMVGAKTKVVLGASNTSYVIGGLKKGKTYYISIRVRKKVNGIDYYTTFGVAKKVKIVK